MNIELKVNDVIVKIGIEMASSIVSSLKDDISNQNIFHELAQHSSASIRKEVAYKDNLSEDTVKLLLEDNDINVLSNLVRTEAAKKVINDEYFDKLLAFNSEDIIENMISYIDDYTLLSDPDECYNKIIELKNDYLTLQVAQNYNTPKKLLKKLLKHSDSDISAAAKYSLD